MKVYIGLKQESRVVEVVLTVNLISLLEFEHNTKGGTTRKLNNCVSSTHSVNFGFNLLE